MTAKQQVVQLLESLPDSCSLAEIQYQLYVIETLRRRIEQADRGPLVSHAEAERRLEKWRVK